MRLRQIALVAAQLEPVVDDLCAVFGIRVAFNDPGVGTYGLENAVMPIGNTFLEVVAPVRPETTAGRYLQRRGGDGGYMVILQSDDLDADRARFAELGIRVVAQLDFDHARGTHLHPRDVGGAILSVDDMDPPESWEWAGPDWKAAVDISLVAGITGVAIQAGDAGALADRWAEVLGREVQTDGAARDI
ncbi:MAG: VOC family protein, partial [Tepidiformaceae bacterium]